MENNHQQNAQNKSVSIYEKLKQVAPESLTAEELSEAIKQDIRCIGLVPKGMKIEGLPKLSKQEIADIKSVSDAFYTDGEFFALPPERRTEAVSQAAVLADSTYLLNVPKNTLSDKFILNVLRMNGMAICAVNPERRTVEMYMTALENSGLALMYIPQEMITPEVAMKAVEKNGGSLQYVPDEMKTPDMCHIALNGAYNPDCKYYHVIRYVPFPDVCLEYLRKIEKENNDPLFAFSNIKPEIMTPEMVNLAVGLNPLCLQFAHDRKKNGELSLAIFSEKLITSEMAMNAVTKNGYALQYIPETLNTPEMCRAALSSNCIDYEVIQFVPFPDVCMEHLKKIE
jgi:hypothetical protein